MFKFFMPRAATFSENEIPCRGEFIRLGRLKPPLKTRKLEREAYSIHLLDCLKRRLFWVSLCLLQALWPLDVNALEDPTKPAYDQMMVEKSSDGLLPKVSSIMISSKGRQAMIDGRMLKVGDWVGDFEVLSIDSNRVKLRREEQVFEVKLVSGFFKKQNKD